MNSFGFISGKVDSKPGMSRAALSPRWSHQLYGGPTPAPGALTPLSPIQSIERFRSDCVPWQQPNAYKAQWLSVSLEKETDPRRPVSTWIISKLLRQLTITMFCNAFWFHQTYNTTKRKLHIAPYMLGSIGQRSNVWQLTFCGVTFITKRACFHFNKTLVSPPTMRPSISPHTYVASLNRWW